jgi:hypothetical protein
MAFLSGKGSRYVHVGSEPDAATGAVVVPISLGTTFAQKTPGVPRGADHAGAYGKGYEYGRTNNPTRAAFERAMAAATEWGLATYEQDWLYNELEGVSQLLTNVTLANAWLRELGVTTIDLVGLQSEMCVRSSTLGARDAGFVARPLPGLHGTYPEGTHDESGPTGVTAAELSARVDAELA